MAFWDFLKRKKKEVVQDFKPFPGVLGTTKKDVVKINAVVPSAQGELTVSGLKDKAKKISEIKKVPHSEFSYTSGRTMGLEEGYVPSEYDLAEIGVVEDVEGIVRQANQKKIALMYKEGFDWIGSNPLTIQYVKTRLAQIERASRISTSTLLRRIGESLVKSSNAFVAKARNPECSGGKVRTTPEGKTLKPVAGYFLLPPETMRVKINDNTGKILGWRQQMPDGRTKDYNPDDIIHFSIYRKEGFVFGTPVLVPVMDDIRSLRHIEENIELLIYQNLFPLFQYRIGTDQQPAGYTEDGKDEIDVAKEQIQYMPAEGGIVTSHRHEIKMIGSEGRALRAEKYLEYFRERVIAGLGISTIDLGQAYSANRASANTLSRQLIDSVKDIQDVLEEQFAMEVVSELLLESTFGFDVLSEKNIVKLRFREIDIENRVRVEEHAANMFDKNGLTYSEFRSALGREPILVPEDGKSQDPKKYPDWFNTKWKLFGEPEALIKAVDEPFLASAQAAAESRSTAITQPQIQKSVSTQKEIDKAAKSPAPKVVAAKKPAAKKKDFLSEQYKDLESDVVQYIDRAVKNLNEISYKQIEMVSNIWVDNVIKTLSARGGLELVSGFNDQTGGRAHQASAMIQSGRNRVTERCRHFLDRLSKDILSRVYDLLKNEITKDNLDSFIAEIRNVFQSLRYRIDYIANVELSKAYNYGNLLGMKFQGHKEIESVPNDSACPKCSSYRGRKLNIDDLDIQDISPHHNGCECHIRPVIQEA